MKRIQTTAFLLALAALAGLTGISNAWAEEIPWQTNQDFEPIGDPKAVKGGTLVDYWLVYPATLRTEGPYANSMQTRTIHAYIYESLMGVHSTTLAYVPSLADKWAISEDKMTFWFHIDPRAKWADGSPVTADDVVATYEHHVDEAIQDPFSNWHYSKYWEKPEAIDASTVKVRCKELNWRLFYYFGGMSIYPAKEIRVPGAEYLEKYQWKLPMGTGPYMLKDEDIVKDESLTLTRREDYWGRDDKANVGLNNFDRLKWVVIRDETLAFEKLKKGELDFYVVGKAQRWHEECDFDKVQQGWVQKRKIYTQSPQGFSGLVFNMRKAPFDDIRVRKAFCHLFNRGKLMEKLFFNEYEYLDSYYPGRDWGNQDNEKIRFDAAKAAALLAEAGYKERNAEGWLVGPDGKVFEIELPYGAEAWTRIWSVVKEDYEKAGIKFNLKLMDARTLMRDMDERNFTIAYSGWSSLIFPNPESSWVSDLADKPSTNNYPGFKSRKVDKLCEEYNVTFERKRQIEIIREVDSIIFKKHPYALGWYAPHTRVLYWNKFGHPKAYFSRTGDQRSIAAMWWFDPEKSKILDEAMKANKPLEVGEVVHRPWEGYTSLVDEELDEPDDGDKEGEEGKGEGEED